MRYRFARVLRRGWGGYLAIALLMGAIGGTALGSLVAARDTQSSYATFLASTNPSDLTLTIYSPDITARLAHLPSVRHVESALFTFGAFPMSSHGTPRFPPAYRSGDVVAAASFDGEYFNQDRVTVTAGRVANPRRADEFMATASAERLLGWHLGQRVLMGFYSSRATSSAGFGTAAIRPETQRYERLVGTIILNYQVLLDNVDRYPTWLLFTPAAARTRSSGVQQRVYSLQLRGGGRSVTRVEREIVNKLPPGNTYDFHVASVVAGQVDRAVRPEALALGVFGVMALLGALLTAVQLIARQLRGRREDQEALRALGARRVDILSDALAGILASVVLGSVLAVGVALLLSRLSPLGPVRRVVAARFHVDALVLAGGGVILALATSAAALALAYRWAPGRRGASVTRLSRGSSLARLGANVGAPVSTVAGLHFALEPGRGRSAVPVRSVLVGVTLAVTLIGATLTFGSGLSTLVAHPALYGWNWDYALTSGYTVPPQSVAAVRRSPLVAAWSGVSFANAQIDGLTVPIILVRPGARVTAPLLTGHAVHAVHQIVLGAATLAELHKHVGDTVVVSYGAKSDYPVYVPPIRLKIVGAATLPAVGHSQILHTSMGTGAMIDVNIEPAAFRKFIKSPYATLNGPGMVLVRLRPTVSRASGLAFLRGVARVGDRALAAVPNGGAGGESVSVLPVQYPAEIVNYRTLGDTPLWLAMGFASGVVVAFALTIVSSVRRRRRDLALLKTLGFTRRQLGAAIAWQATVAVVLGLVIGIPAGIVLGRWLWDLFAGEIYAVPRATVPALSLVLLGVGAVVLANTVAVLPGRSAARTRAAVSLRAE